MDVKHLKITLPGFIKDTFGALFWKRLFKLLLILNALLLLATYSLFTIDDRYTQKFIDGILIRAQFSTFFNGYPAVIAARLKSTFTPVNHVYLDIKHKHVQRLNFERENALSGERDFSYVPARITNDAGEHSKVKLRLKGDRKIHWDHFETSSYRLRVKGDNTIYGMKKFSLQKPRARNYIHEWIYLELMRQEGIITPRYKFINLHVNGKNLGPYVIEEHYDKHLIEANRRKEGPIIRIDENSPNYAKDFLVKQIVPYNEKKWTTPERLPLTSKAIHLLEAFRQGEITVSDAFDAQKLATFLAIADLTGGQHGIAAKSMRFYYNPITSKLEPIAFDGHPHLQLAQGGFLSSDFGNTKRGRNWVSSIHGNWIHRIFNDKDKFDKAFIKHYIKALYRLSKEEYLNDFFTDKDTELTQNLAVIYTEIPLEDKSNRYGPAPFIFDKNYYYDRQKLIQKRLNGVTATAYLKEEKDKIELQIQNSSTALPIEFLNLQCGSKHIKPASKQPTALPETATDGTPILHKLILLKPDNFNLRDCTKMHYRIIGEDDIRTIQPSIISYENHQGVYADFARSKGNMHIHPFLTIQGKTILISPGIHQVNKSIIIPAGFTLNATAGTTLSLNNGAMIYSMSPIIFTGNKDKHIVLTSDDGTGQGLTVINAGEESKLDYVDFSNITSPNQNGWTLSGAINFYESPVSISNTEIRNTISEDAINIVRSSFKLNNVIIDTTKSDAIDIDYGEGEIINTTILHAGNDAIDVSGTRLKINSVFIDKAEDKAISAGELSQIDGENIEIKGSEIGIASKDSSTVSLSNIKITDTKISLTAYNKKPEFGSGTISLFNYHADENEKVLIERRSTLIIDGARTSGKEINVEKKMYGNIYGKSSK